MAAAEVVLTVAQSKRLIARAIPHVPEVKRALSQGLVIVCKGSTTAYVAEELLGRKIRKDTYVYGRTLPAGFTPPDGLFAETMPEVVLRKGRPVEGLSFLEAVASLGPGDVVIKGANLLDYRAGLVANLIGHTEGGTMGAVLGHIHGRGAYLVVPVGLEKLVAGDLLAIARRLDETHADTSLPRLWTARGIIVTEIEALAILAGVEAVHTGSGGICGAEGAVRLRLFGPGERLEHALSIVKQVQQEPSFLEDCRSKAGSGGGEDG
ncbi:MAG: hypothetical protein H5T86_08105 [Armatimonadetes bacterium]|nr:hypothetical protein [Armatimonadota bacterium]